MQQKTNDIIKYLKICHRRRYLFVVISLLVMSLITAYSYLLPRKYQADSTVFIEENIINQLVEGIAMTPDISDQIKVLQFALLSRDIVTKVLEDIDSDIFTKSTMEQQDFITNLREKIEIRVKGKELFTVSLTHSDPAFAQSFVNTLVSKYVEENISSKRNESYGANRFLVEQLELFKERLDQAETAIIDFRKERGVYLALDERTELAEIKQFMREAENIELELQTLNARQTRLTQQLVDLPRTVDIFSGAGGRDQLVQLEGRLHNMLLRFNDDYPEVVRLKAEIESLKQLEESTESSPADLDTRLTSMNPLYQDVQQTLLEVEAEVSALQARKENLHGLISSREKNLREVPVHQKELAVLIQERNSHREIYQELLKRMGQSEVSKQMEISDKASTFRIVDPADYPEIPVSPNMPTMILLAIVGGLGCGLGAALFAESLDTSVNDPSQIEELQVDILAMVPNIAVAASGRKGQRGDRLLYAFGACCLSCFLLLFAYEALHQYIDPALTYLTRLMSL
ncbi:MAG: hypothetical protein C0618_04950 [Desulfuromonas sp.]|nr:MAG: hypothetical protein C0618_04950 [Desulfuromonas sp.]